MAIFLRRQFTSSGSQGEKSLSCLKTQVIATKSRLPVPPWPRSLTSISSSGSCNGNRWPRGPAARPRLLQAQRDDLSSLGNYTSLLSLSLPLRMSSPHLFHTSPAPRRSSSNSFMKMGNGTANGASSEHALASSWVGHQGAAAFDFRSKYLQCVPAY